MPPYVVEVPVESQWNLDALRMCTQLRHVAFALGLENELDWQGSQPQEIVPELQATFHELVDKLPTSVQTLTVRFLVDDVEHVRFVDWELLARHLTKTKTRLTVEIHLENYVPSCAHPWTADLIQHIAAGLDDMEAIPGTCATLPRVYTSN